MADVPQESTEEGRMVLESAEPVRSPQLVAFVVAAWRPIRNLSPTAVVAVGVRAFAFVPSVSFAAPEG